MPRTCCKTFFAAGKRPGNLLFVQDPEAYLSRAAINASLDLLRSRTRAKSIGLDEADADALAARTRNPEALHADRELQDLVRQAVSRLGKTAARRVQRLLSIRRSKRKTIWAGPVLRPAARLIDRHESVVCSRREDGEWDVLAYQLSSFDSMTTQFADPRNARDAAVARTDSVVVFTITSARMSRHPARLPQIGTHTTVLGDDGSDLAAALQTIQEIGDPSALAEAVDDAFPGSSVSVVNIEGRFEIAMHQRGLLRPLKATELSDGTLRYLLWIAALLTPRPPGLLVLNEPETSLHPDLLQPLGD